MLEHTGPINYELGVSGEAAALLISWHMALDSTSNSPKAIKSYTASGGRWLGSFVTTVHPLTGTRLW